MQALSSSLIFSSLVTFNNEILFEMAQKHHKSVAQIVSLDTGHTYATARNTGKAVTEFLEKANFYHMIWRLL